MKKFISFILSVIFVFAVCVPAFANDASGNDETEKITDVAYGIYNSEEGSKASGLITGNTLSLSKSGSSLKINARTTGISDVTKCGFTYIKLQKLVNGNWVDQSSYCYTDQYSNSNNFSFSRTVSPGSGTYRLIAEHYAEKPFLVIFKSKEKVYNETSSIVL